MNGSTLLSGGTVGVEMEDESVRRLGCRPDPIPHGCVKLVVALLLSGCADLPVIPQREHATARAQEIPFPQTPNNTPEGFVAFEYKPGWQAFETRITILTYPQLRLKARWPSPYGDEAYSIDTAIGEQAWWLLLEELSRFRTRRSERLVIDAGRCGLTVDTPELKYAFEFMPGRGEASDPSGIIAAFKNRWLAYAKVSPMGMAESRGRWMEDSTGGETALPYDEAQNVVRRLSKENAQVYSVLAAGRHRNHSVVRALLELLYHNEPRIRRAACASLSRISGKPPSEDPRVWEDWWIAVLPTYQVEKDP